MRTTTITKAKNGLSALIDRVRAGESVVILDRGTPVAVLQPISRRGRSDGRLQRLERAGIIRVGATAPSVELIREPGPSVAAGASAVSAVAEERREGR